MPNVENNKRIAKNTLMLYFRMALIMMATLYTSRVVLQVLGIEDFGIYNVIGGIVTYLSSLNSSLSVTTQRFLSYEMAENKPENLSRVFSVSLTIHYIIAVFIVIIAETIGLWFVRNQLVIPENRLSAALWLYQFSVFTIIVNIISVPYNAAIIATERMNIYAYVSIIETLLKLAAAFLLVYVFFDKLVLYSVLLFVIAIIIRFIYFSYCKKKLLWCHYKLAWDIFLFKKMISFSGLTTLGTTIETMSRQGISILINIFFGPVHNAAQAIAIQVQGAVRNFSSNFMVSVRPQIIKCFSQKEFQYTYRLVFISSKISYYLLFILSFPILLKTEYILTIWLGNIPNYSVLFIRLALIDVLILTLITPLWALSQASGKIGNIQVISMSCYIFSFIITAILYQMKLDSYIAFSVMIVLNSIELIAILINLKSIVDFPVKEYLFDVLLKILLVTCIAVPFSIFFYKVISLHHETVVHFITTVLLTTISSIIAIWLTGLSHYEKTFVLHGLSKTLKKH